MTIERAVNDRGLTVQVLLSRSRERNIQEAKMCEAMAGIMPPGAAKRTREARAEVAKSQLKTIDEMLARLRKGGS